MPEPRITSGIRLALNNPFSEREGLRPEAHGIFALNMMRCKARKLIKEFENRSDGRGASTEINRAWYCHQISVIGGGWP